MSPLDETFIVTPANPDAEPSLTPINSLAPETLDAEPLSISVSTNPSAPLTQDAD
jgi:hypothetical protein